MISEVFSLISLIVAAVPIGSISMLWIQLRNLNSSVEDPDNLHRIRIQIKIQRESQIFISFFIIPFEDVTRTLLEDDII